MKHTPYLRWICLSLVFCFCLLPAALPVNARDVLDNSKKEWGETKEGVSMSIWVDEHATNVPIKLKITIKNTGTNNAWIGVLYPRVSYDVFITYYKNRELLPQNRKQWVHSHELIGGSATCVILKPGEEFNEYVDYPLSDVVSFKEKGDYRIKLQRGFRLNGGRWIEFSSNEIEIVVE